MSKFWNIKRYESLTDKALYLTLPPIGDINTYEIQIRPTNVLLTDGRSTLKVKFIKDFKELKVIIVELMDHHQELWELHNDDELFEKWETYKFEELCGEYFHHDDVDYFNEELFKDMTSDIYFDTRLGVK